MPQIQFRRAEDQIEIAERIEIAEIGTVPRNGLVIRAEENLGAAKRVLDILAKQPAEREAERLVRNHVEELHGLAPPSDKPGARR